MGIFTRNKEKDFINPSLEKKESEKGSLKDWFDGNLLVREKVEKQFPFIVFLTALAMLYIGNKYNYERKLEEYKSTKKEVSVLRNKSLLIGSELMKMSRQSQVVKRIEAEGLELKPSVEPPLRVVVEK